MDTIRERVPLNPKETRVVDVNNMLDNKIVYMRPPYQRQLVWNEKDKQLLIDSLLRNYPIGKLYWLEVDSPPYRYEVIDGQQRLDALRMFMDVDSKLRLPEESGALEGKTFGELDPETKQKLNHYKLDIEVVRGATEKVVQELFRRFQLGKPLTPGERLNALPGSMRDFVVELTRQHKLFMIERIAFAPKRGAHVEVAAQMTRLGLERRPCDVGYKDLERMFHDYQNWDHSSKEAQRVVDNLDYLVKVLAANGYRPDKTKTVTLFLFVSSLRKVFPVTPKQLIAFIKDFEAARRAPDPERDDDLQRYNKVIYGGAWRRTSLRERLRILTARFLIAHPNLAPYGDEFTDEQRWAIYRRDKGICQKCHKEVPFEGFQVHHKKPRRLGGKPRLSNGELLCPSCHYEVTAADKRREQGQ